jgi:hypothetical protein
VEGGCFCQLGSNRTCSPPPVVTLLGNRDKGGARGANEGRLLAFR